MLLGTKASKYELNGRVLQYGLQMQLNLHRMQTDIHLHALGKRACAI
jgi:hypothetical protein